MRVAAYLRYSSALQKPTSIEDQRSMIERYCARQGWALTREFVDVEKTGKNTRRPGFQALKAAVAAGDIDVVVVEDIDRFTRRVSDALKEFEVLQFKGVDLHSVKDGKHDFLQVMLRALGAQMFSESIGGHTRRGLGKAVTRKRVHTISYGYSRLDGPENGLNRTIVPDEARIVLRIFTEFAEGRSSNQIAEGLNRDRIPAPRGGSWDGSTIRGNASREEGILRNPLYIGHATVCKYERTAHPETGRRRAKASPQHRVEAEIPELRIVPQELWDAAQAELAHRSAKLKKAGNPRAAHRARYLLSGLLTCGCCGAPYIVTGATSYQCRENRKRACNNSRPISRRRIEQRVFDSLRTVLRSPELAERFDRALAEERQRLLSADSAGDLTRQRAALADLQSRQDKLLAMIEAGVDVVFVVTRARALERETTEVRSTIADLERRIAGAGRDISGADLFEAALARMEHLLSDRDLVDQASALLRDLIDRIVLTPDPEAQHGLAATIETRFAGLLRSAGGASLPDGSDEGTIPIPC